MKGLVFTEFLDMVEHVFDDDMVDRLIDTTNPESKGAYTSVGSYPYEELEAMLLELHRQSGLAISTLLTAFGKHLAAQFSHRYGHFFDAAGSTINLLKQIDNHIHVEVRKLYPDAELPEFSYEEYESNKLKLLYQSKRPLADLAHGLIIQSAQYFNEKIHIEKTDWQENDLHKCEFLITKQGG